MWDATVSVASSSNFGPGWDDVDIDPNQPAYATYFHPVALRQKKTRHSTFGRAQKMDYKVPKDDGFALAEAAETWLNRDVNDKMRSRPRILQHFGKVDVTPGPLDYDATTAAKTLQYRHKTAEVRGRWKEKTRFTEDMVPGPGQYKLPSQLNVTPPRPQWGKKKKKQPESGPTMKELKALIDQTPGPGKYRPDYKNVVSAIPRPVMRPKKRVAKSRVVLNLRNLDILSTEEMAKEVGVRFKGLRKAETSPGPGQYVDIMKQPRPYDGFKHTSTKDILGERRSYVVGGNNEVSTVGPGQYEQGVPFSAEDRRVKWSTEAIREKMGQTTAVAGTVPWLHLVAKADLSKIKSQQLVETYKSDYSYPKPRQVTGVLPMGSVRFNTTVQNYTQHFDFSKATMKTK